MEQTTQQITEKLIFPIKTRIAAWWLIIIGVLGLIFSVWNFLSRNFLSILFSFLGKSWGPQSGWALVVILPFILIIVLSLFFLIPGIFLLKKKRLAWWISIIIHGLISLYFFSRLFTLTIFLVSLNVFDFYYLLSFLIPFILLLLDRKNFFKIAS